MQAARRALAANSRQFGRAPLRTLEPMSARAAISDDLKLFLTTFAAGFVFVSVLLA